MVTKWTDVWELHFSGLLASSGDQMDAQLWSQSYQMDSQLQSELSEGCINMTTKLSVGCITMVTKATIIIKAYHFLLKYYTRHC